MRRESTVYEMKRRVAQDMVDGFLHNTDWLNGVMYALEWVLGDNELEKEVKEFEVEVENTREGLEKDPNTGEWVSIVELYPEDYDEEYYEIYIGDDWREVLDARGFDWINHLNNLEGLK